MSAYKAHDLPMDIIHCIADAVHDSIDLTYSGTELLFPIFRCFLTNMQRLNKHWCTSLRAHPAYMTYECGMLCAEGSVYDSVKERNEFLEKNIADFQSWLQVPYRRDRVVHKLTIILEDEIYCQALRSIFDDKFGEITTHQVRIISLTWSSFIMEPLPVVRLPSSLKARDIFIDLNRCSLLDWSTFSDYARHNATSLSIRGLKTTRDLSHNLPSHTVFQKLSKLSVEFSYSAYDFEIFLKAHPTVDQLEVFICRLYNTPKPQQSLRGMDKIKSLKCNGAHLLFSSSHLSALKQLTIEDMCGPLLDWSDMPASLEELRIQYVGISRDIYPYDYRDRYADYIGEDHLLFSLTQLQKLHTLKVLEFTHTKSPTLARKFNDGAWDDVMPYLEVLKLEIDGVAKKAVDRFVSKHPRLKSVSYGVEYGFNERRKDRYIKGPLEAYRCK